MRFTSTLIAGFVLVLAVTASPVSSLAQDTGLTKLLEIFESKGILTADEVKLIRQAAAVDLQKLQEKEQEIQRREQQLLNRENILTRQEKAFPDQTPAESTAGEPTSRQAASQGADSGKLQESVGEVRLNAGYDRGFCLQAGDPKEMSLCLGGLLQTDYRHSHYEGGDPEDNRFDIRRSRLKLSGSLMRYIGYKFEYEFQGTSSRNLLDAYADINALPYASLRLGQFKEPFGLEQYSPVANLFFTEPSFGYYVTPGRDVGGMVYGSVMGDRLNYGVGVFNGDGLDDSSGADSDYLQTTGRMVLAPFRGRQMTVGENLQFGGSFNYGKIDRNNVDVQVQTAGLKTFFDISPNDKFAVIQDADKLYRYGAELAWAVGPVALMSEYTWVRYKDIETSSSLIDLDLDAYYASMIWMLTGERPTFRHGVFQSIIPNHSIGRGGWGAWGLGLRYNHFKAGNNVYNTLVEPGDSVRKADAYTVALNWYLNPFAQIMLDYTRTKFDRGLLVDRDSNTGEAIYSDYEDEFCARLQLSF